MHEIATHPSGDRNDNDAGQLHKKSLSLGAIQPIIHPFNPFLLLNNYKPGSLRKYLA